MEGMLFPISVGANFFLKKNIFIIKKVKKVKKIKLINNGEN